MLKTLIPSVRACIRTSLLQNETPIIQPFRTTFILKRRWPPGLHKSNQKPHKLKPKNYVYDLVEDTMIRKRPNLEVILTSFVDGIGNKGDVICLKPNFVYNKLLLPGLAVYKTPENMLKYSKSAGAAAVEEKETITHSSPFAQRTINVLEMRTLAVVMNKDNPWVIEPWHIRTSLRKAGIYATDDSIELPNEPITGPDLLKQNKEFIVTVTVNNLEKAKVRCRIHHWSSDTSERLPHVNEHWNEPAESLFGSAGGGGGGVEGKSEEIASK